MSYLDKVKIKSNFNRYSKNYASHGALQETVARGLFEWAKSKIEKSNNIIDLGSGIGFVGKNILTLNKFSDKNIFQLDLAFESLRHNCISGPGVFNVNADIEDLPFKSEVFDLAISSLAFQWLRDFDLVFSGIKSVLKPNSSVFFSIFLDETLFELKRSVCGTGIDLSVNDFIDFNDLSLFLENNFDGHKIHLKDIVMEYDDVYGLLKSIKNVGASYSDKGTVLNRKSFEDLNRFYLKKFNNNGKLRSTWKVAYVEAFIGGS
jgi:malonyl-CoA O-methyltransferase